MEQKGWSCSENGLMAMGGSIDANITNPILQKLPEFEIESRQHHAAASAPRTNTRHKAVLARQYE